MGHERGVLEHTHPVFIGSELKKKDGALMKKDDALMEKDGALMDKGFALIKKDGALNEFYERGALGGACNPFRAPRK